MLFSTFAGRFLNSCKFLNLKLNFVCAKNLLNYNLKSFSTVRSANNKKIPISKKVSPNFPNSPNNANSPTNSISTEILIFSYNSDTFYKVLSAFGILQTIFWINLSSLSLVEVKSDRDVLFLSDFQQKHKHKLAGGIMLLGALVLFFSLMYPLRTVKKITLLKNNKEIQLSTYSFFGRTRSFKVNLDDISCKQSREAKSSHLPMKIRGKFFYFLLDKKSGIFHEPRLFDQVVGLNRSLA